MKQIREHSAAALEAAIASLKQFAGISATARTPHAAELSVQNGKLVAIQESFLKKGMRCIAAFFSKELRDKHAKRKIQVQNMMLNAIDTVKRNHLVIERLKLGNNEEKELASCTLEAIKNYNATLDHIQKRSPDLSTRMARFIYKYSGFSLDQDIIENRIDLPPTPSLGISTDTPSNGDDGIGEIAQTPPNQEADLLRMKTNTLLKKHGICFKSIDDAFKSVKSAPILATVNSQSQTSTLFLTLNVLPGTTIKVQGSFKRDTQAHSAPITESFRLSVKSMHSGFPHPSQHTGWSLSDSLMPLYPYRLDLLPLFKPLYERKQQTALALLPDGKLLEHAKQLIVLKHTTFNAYRNTLTSLHQQLCHAILSAAPQGQLHPQSRLIIDRFFHELEKETDPWQKLTETYYNIIERYVAPMHARLQKAWVDHQDVQLLSNNPAVVLKAAQRLFESTSKDAEIAISKMDTTFDSFVRMIGALLNNAAKTICLQHWSEALRCAPPLLHDFEYKVQAATYAQLTRFLDELECKQLDSKKLFADMQQQLLEDISLFQASSFNKVNYPCTEIVHELEEYFGSRYLCATYGLKD